MSSSHSSSRSKSSSSSSSSSSSPASRTHRHVHSTAFAGRYTETPIPKYHLPDKECAPKAAKQLIHDQMALDGNPTLNLASFVATWMDPEAEQLMLDSMRKNHADGIQYPQVREITTTCVNMLANLFHRPDSDEDTLHDAHQRRITGRPTSSHGIRKTRDTSSSDDGNELCAEQDTEEQATKFDRHGVACTGSSEAIMLGGLAMKFYWKKTRGYDEIMPAPTRPNLIFSAGAHVTALKFCRYHEIEPRIVPFKKNTYRLDIDRAISMCDENTIGVMAILGNTLVGQFDDIKELNNRLEKLNAERGWDIGIHVDGASGAFVAAFCYPELEWDFRLPLVRSINVSGHKYGLVYAGIGWVLWRSAHYVPDSLVFHMNYLGEDESTFSLNFSASSAPVVGQYYNFIRLGREGYRKILQCCLDNAGYIASHLSKMHGWFHLDSDNDGLTIPVAAFHMSDQLRNCGLDEFQLATALRVKGWIVPAYNLCPDVEKRSVMRIVVRESFTRELCDKLIADIESRMHSLIRNKHIVPKPLSEHGQHCLLPQAQKQDTQTRARARDQHSSQTQQQSTESSGSKHQAKHKNIQDAKRGSVSEGKHSARGTSSIDPTEAHLSDKSHPIC